jgi:pyridoxine 4-dehydrogenase
VSAPPETVAIGDLPVRRLGLGTMALTGRGTWGDPPDPAAARALLRRAAELGVQLFDTADAYGPETAERLLREALHPYDGLLVATKGGFRRRGPHEWEADCRPESLRAACEGSLRRLGLERIDLYQLHVVDAAVPIEESVGALEELRREGKIRHVGVCNVDAAQLARARTASTVVSVQNRLSLAERGLEELVPACEDDGTVFIAWAPLGKGRLARAGGTLGAVARSRGATPAQIALAWLLQLSPSLAAIPGTASSAHLEENAAAARIRLSPDELVRIGRARLWRYRAWRAGRRARMLAGRVRRRVPGAPP